MFTRRIKILPNSFWLAIALLVIQQLIVASSSIWITKLILHISEETAIFWLLLYLIALFLPYIPGAFALVAVAKSQTQTVVNYVHKFSEIYPGKIVEWSNHDQHATKSSILSGESYHVIHDYVEYLYHLASSGLNVSLNIIILSLLVDPLLLITYLIGTSLAFIILHLQKKTKKNLSLKAQQSRIRWTSLLLKGWDNVLLNNLYNFNIWKDKAQKRGNRLVSKWVQLEKFNQFVSISLAFFLMFPSIALIVYLFFTNLHNVSYLSVLVVILPRLFQILSYSYEFLFLLSNFPMQSVKMDTVLSLIDDEDIGADAPLEMAQRVNWKSIKALVKNKSNEIIDLPPENLIDQLPEAGRITLQGDNGSGKTSLLLSLKMKHGDDAFYLPAKHDLLFKIGKNKFSTGQFSCRVLNEINKNLHTKVFLLDEWDANLDNKNRDNMSKIIDELAQNYCVVEILHKHH